MPICRKCGSRFPCNVVIENKKRNLGSRKFCLLCSPFGLHNTRVLEKVPEVKFPCPQCGKKLRSFSPSSKCESCLAFNRRSKNKDKAYALLGSKCVVCGYDRCLGALDFHHIDSASKKFEIGNKLGCSWKILESELKKCVVLCCRCHREYHCGLFKLNEEVYVQASLG